MPAVTRAARSACLAALDSYSDTSQSARELVADDEDLGSLQEDDVTDSEVVTEYSDDLDALSSLVSTEGASCSTSSVGSLVTTSRSLGSSEDGLTSAMESVTASAEQLRSSHERKQLSTAPTGVETQLTLASRTLDSLTAVTSASTSLTDVVGEAQDFVDSYSDTADLDAESLEAAITRADDLAEAVSQARILAEVSDIVGSTRVGIDIVDLATGDAVFQINAEETFTTASTYKLFVASAMADAVESGDLTWSSDLDGVTLGECLSRMILVSDNSCPQTWLQTYGYQTLEDLAHDLGATHTSLRYADLNTTPSDMTTLLTSLRDGTLMDSADTERLISLMQQQEYREGLGTLEPAEATVADVARAIYDWLGERP